MSGLVELVGTAYEVGHIFEQDLVCQELFPAGVGLQYSGRVEKPPPEAYKLPTGS